MLFHSPARLPAWRPLTRSAPARRPLPLASLLLPVAGTRAGGGGVDTSGGSAGHATVTRWRLDKESATST